MSIAGIVRGIEANAVVADMKRAFSVTDELNVNPACLGMLAHVGKRLMHNMHCLQYMLRRQIRYSSLAGKSNANTCLPLKLLQRATHGSFQIRIADTSAKMHQQLAHIVIAFLHSFPDLLQALQGSGYLPLLQIFVQQLYLDIQEGERLRNTV